MVSIVVPTTLWLFRANKHLRAAHTHGAAEIKVQYSHTQRVAMGDRVWARFCQETFVEWRENEIGAIIWTPFRNCSHGHCVTDSVAYSALLVDNSLKIAAWNNYHRRHARNPEREQRICAEYNVYWCWTAFSIFRKVGARALRWNYQSCCCLDNKCVNTTRNTYAMHGAHAGSTPWICFREFWPHHILNMCLEICHCWLKSRLNRKFALKLFMVIW